MLDNAINATLNSAPELTNSPSAAVAVGQGSLYSGLSPSQSAQAVAHASNINNLNNAQTNVIKKTSQPWWKRAVTDVVSGVYKVGHVANQATFGIGGQIIGDVSHIANAGLQEVQHQYRYLHDVEARHGFFAAALDGLGILGGSAVGFIGSGFNPGGAVLGADVAGGIEARINHVDSWNRTASGANYQGTYNRQTGQYSGPKGQVSIGRDLVSAIGLHRNALLSGIVDATFDLGADPIAQGLGLAKGIQEGQYVATSEADFAKIASKNSFQRAAEDLAGKNALQIAAQDPRLAPIAPELGAATTPQEVQNVLYGAWKESLLRSPTQTLPHTSLPTELGQKVNQAVQNYSGPGSKITHALTAYTKESIDYTGSTPELAGHNVLPLTDNSNVVDLRNFYNKTIPNKLEVTVDPITHETLSEPRVYHAKELADTLASEVMSSTGDTQARMNIVNNQLRYLVQQTHPDFSADDINKIVDGARPALMNNIEGGVKGLMGFDHDGSDLSMAPKLLQDGSEGKQAQAIWTNQQGHMIIPDATQFRHDLLQVGGLRKAGWAMDDWMASHATRAFKSLAVLSPATYERILLNETLPEFFRGPLTYIKNLAANSFAKSSFDAVARGQQDDVAASALNRFMNVTGIWHKGGNLADKVRKAAVKDPTTMYVAQRMAAENSGRAISNAVVGSKDLAQAEIGQGANSALDTLAHLVGTPTLKDGAWKTYANTDEDQAQAWMKQLLGLKSQGSAKAGAQSLLNSFNSSAVHDDAWMAKAMADAKDVMAEQLAKEQPGVLSGMSRLYGVGEDGKVAYQQDAKLADLAETQAKALRGLTFAPKSAGNVAHTDILDALANDGRIDPKIIDNIPTDMRPLNVAGRNLIQVPPQGWIARGTEVGWKHIGDPMMESISRGPQFDRRMTQELKYYTDRAAKAGITLEPDDIWRKAMESSVVGMQPLIHNPTERSLFADMARNFMPFYYAQEQAYKRLGRLAIENPMAFRREQIAANAISNAGSTVTDANGQQQFVYPGAAFLHSGMTKSLGLLGIPIAGSIPVSIGAQLKGLSTVIPGAEGTALQFGPLVSVPLHTLQNWMPESTPLVHGILGDVGASGSVWEQILPNAVLRNTVKAFTADHSRSFQNSMMNTMQAMMYHDDSDATTKAWNDAYGVYQQVQADPNAAFDPSGVFKNAVKSLKAPTNLNPTQQKAYLKAITESSKEFLDGKGMTNYPGLVPTADAGDQQLQKFVDRVRNQTRVNFLFRAALGGIVPASPTLEFGNAGLRAEYQKMIQNKGISQASIDFIKKYPDATAYTVFQTKAANGQSLPDTAQGMDWINKNGNLIKSYPYGAAWLVPQPTGKSPFSASAYNEQIATHARIAKQPDQFVKDLYIAKGNAEYYNDSQPNYLQAVADAQGDSVKTAQVHAQWSQYLAAFGAQNPYWNSDHLSADRQTARTLALQQLNEIFAKGQAPKGQQSDDVRALIQQYETYRQAGLVANQQYGTGAKDTLNKNWSDYLDNVKRSTPNLGPIIDKIFRVETA